MANAVVNGMNAGGVPVGAFDQSVLPNYVAATSALSASNCPGADTKELDVPNAVELVFKTPYAVPDDRTFAEIQCTTQQLPNASSACTNGMPDLSATVVTVTNIATNPESTYITCKEGDSTYWRNDPMHVFQNSVMFSGFGAGNCWYMGRLTAENTVNKHTFRCNNIGAIAANTEMTLAFQFVVRNQGKTMIDNGDGILANIVSTMSCDLSVKTRQGSNTKTEWFA